MTVRAICLTATCILAAACGDATPDNNAFLDAYHGSRAAEVTVQGTVSELLPDSPAYSDGPHQRFDVTVSGVVVEIDYNLDLAPRVPTHIGDVVVIHGQFEPDPGHPIIHDVHHATGSHEGGWLDLNGQRYQ